jgi:hypothetical protein
MASRKEFSAEFLIKIFKFVMTRYEQGLTTKPSDIYVKMFDRKYEIDLALIFLNDKKLMGLEEENGQVIVAPQHYGRYHWRKKAHEVYPSFFAVKEY